MNNDPVNYVDLWGYIPDAIWDGISLAIGVRSFIDNVQRGRTVAAIVDAVGIVVDAAALATPFVPGGVGTAIKSVRAATKIDNALDVAKVSLGINQTVTGVIEDDPLGVIGGAASIASGVLGLTADYVFGLSEDAMRAAQNAAASGAKATWAGASVFYDNVADVARGAGVAADIAEVKSGNNIVV